MKFFSIFIFFLPITLFAIVNTEALRVFDHAKSTLQSVHLALNLERGNTHKSGADFAYRLDLRKRDYSHFLVLNYSFDKDDSTVDVNHGFAHGRFVFNLTSKLCHEYFLQEEYDANLDLRYRRLAGLGIRYYLHHRDAYELYGGLGVFLEEESYDDVDQVLHTRLATYLSTVKRVSDSFVYTNTSYFQPAYSDIQNFRVFSVHQFSYEVSDFLSLTFDFKFKFDNKPYKEGLKKEDISYTQGFSFSF